MHGPRCLGTCNAASFQPYPFERLREIIVFDQEISKTNVSLNSWLNKTLRDSCLHIMKSVPRIHTAKTIEKTRLHPVFAQVIYKVLNPCPTPQLFHAKFTHLCFSPYGIEDEADAVDRIDLWLTSQPSYRSTRWFSEACG